MRVARPRPVSRLLDQTALHRSCMPIVRVRLNHCKANITILARLSFRQSPRASVTSLSGAASRYSADVSVRIRAPRNIKGTVERNVSEGTSKIHFEKISRRVFWRRFPLSAERRNGRPEPMLARWLAPGIRQVYSTGCGGNVAAGKYNDGSR